MNKVILKSAIITVASIVLAALFVFSLWILISPQTMASACENTGNYSFAVTCANLRYKYTNDVYDLARCAQDSILAKKDNLVVEYCEKLVEDSKFEEVCTTKDEYISSTDYGEYASGYKKYIFANLSRSQYRTGNLDGAITSAQKGASFSKLVLEIIEKEDIQSASKVLSILKDYDEDLYKLLEKFTKGV